METNTKYLRKHLWNSLVTPNNSNIPSLDKLQKTEWSDEFEKFMRNRLIMGHFRYGPFDTKNKPTKNIINYIVQQANDYLNNRNTEVLVDIANMCMKLFVTDDHPKKHFKATDDKTHVK